MHPCIAIPFLWHSYIGQCGGCKSGSHPCDSHPVRLPEERVLIERCGMNSSPQCLGTAHYMLPIMSRGVASPEPWWRACVGPQMHFARPGLVDESDQEGATLYKAERTFLFESMHGTV